MTAQTVAILICGTICVLALLMFTAERRAAARRLKERGGREIDVSNLIAFGSQAGEGEVTHR